MSLQRAIEQQTMIAQDQRCDLLPEERPLASDRKTTSIYLEGVQKPHRSKALGVAKGPVYHGISDFTAACPREGNTCSFLRTEGYPPI